MKKTILYLLLLSSQCYTAIAQQAVAPQVLQNYPKNVVLQVFDLVNKTNIDDTKQLEVADIIKQRDNEVFDLLQAGASAAQINTVKSQYDEQIYNLFDLEERYNKYVNSKKEINKGKYSYTQFAAAIRFRDSLELSQEQYDLMLSYADSLKTFKTSYYNQYHKPYDSRAYESQRMINALSNAQYDMLLTIKNRTKAQMLAETDWAEVVQRGIDSSFVKDVALFELTRYYLARECTYNKYQHDIIKQKMQIRELYANRPTIIRVLQKVRRNPDNDTATKIFKW